MIGLAIVFVINSASKNVIERNVHDYMVHAKRKCVRQHSRCCLNQKSLFCLGGFVRIRVLCDTLRICHISLIADNRVFTAIVNRYHKAGIQAVILRSMIERKLERKLITLRNPGCIIRPAL